MPVPFVMPRTPSYVIPGGVPVFYRPAINKALRKVSGDVRTFILHDTDGRDSRQELYDSERIVSVHYLVGQYIPYDTPIAIKYASETHDATFGAGHGSIGGIGGNLNDTAVQFELEWYGITDATKRAFARVVAHSLFTWSKGNKTPIIIPHWSVDARKQDPRYDWTHMLSLVYEFYEQLHTASDKIVSHGRLGNV